MEDYTNAVTYLLPRGEWTIIDTDNFDELSRHKWRSHPMGKPVGPNKVKHRRVVRGTGKGGQILLHRELMNAPSGMVVDHINRNTLDNRLSNLRVCTVRENNLNRGGNANSKSKFKGVGWSSKQNKWKVITGTKHARVYCGAFDDEVAAARAYNEYAKAHFGPTAFLNPV